MGSKRIEADAVARANEGWDYRRIVGGLMEVKKDVKTRRPQPEVVVKLDVTNDDAEVIKELLGNPALEFKVTAVDSPDGVRIDMHIRLKRN